MEYLYVRLEVISRQGDLINAVLDDGYGRARVVVHKDNTLPKSVVTKAD